MPVIKQNFPSNITLKDEPIFKVALEHYIPEAKIIVIKNCWWDITNGNELKGFSSKFRCLIKSAFKMKLFKTIEMAACVLDKYSGNYFHWINDVLPKIILLKSEKINCPIIITDDVLKFKYIEESLQFLNISYLVFPKYSIYKFQVLYLPKVGGSGSQDLYYFPLVQKMLKKMSNPIVTGKILFISRQGANTRKIIHFKEIEKLLKDKNVEIVYPELLTLKEQCDLFSAASHLIGLHGAGLTNMIFMCPDCRVLEIRRNDDIKNYCYFFMASTLKLKYYYFMADGAGISSIVQEDDMFIDIEKFKKILNNFLMS